MVMVQTVYSYVHYSCTILVYKFVCTFKLSDKRSASMVSSMGYEVFTPNKNLTSFYWLPRCVICITNNIVK